jgi:hypothetical protein
VGVRSLGTTLAASVQLTVSGGDDGHAVATCSKDHSQAPQLKYAWDGAFKVKGGQRSRLVPEKTIGTAPYPGEYRYVPAAARLSTRGCVECAVREEVAGGGQSSSDAWMHRAGVISGFYQLEGGCTFLGPELSVVVIIWEADKV